MLLRGSKKAVDYCQETNIEVAFVATNSITQGEQPGILWPELHKKGVTINFAHRTFRWSNEAKGKAQVHVVIIGFSFKERPLKLLYHYESGEPLEIKAKQINSYLIDAPEVVLQTRGKPVGTRPEMFKGSQPTDGGYLLLSEREKHDLIERYAIARNWIRKFIGAEEFINNTVRYCLWLKNVQPSELKKVPPVLLRLEQVKESRLKSPTQSVKDYAKFPYLFTQDRQPATEYIAVPEVSSENRDYVPMGFLPPEVVCSNKLQIIPSGSLFLFGVLQSAMHMAWIKTVCGRMKSDYSYAPFIYNNFPWPEKLPKQKVEGVEKLAQQVLKVRERHKTSSLADLYDPLTMPADLVRAHRDLDKFVDTCYRVQPFETEIQRIAFLFELYQQYAQPLFSQEAKKGKKRKLA